MQSFIQLSIKVVDSMARIEISCFIGRSVGGLDTRARSGVQVVMASMA